ncbi:MAG TPA: hypothetical protein H9935_14975 [Candidatus Blautia merdigallinarum]|uniref:Uncharacterized protein n=1 Tax=Candidatus Blautia merdigallinarum TaxID=2838495 RepID=A0A9D2N9G4_9FIRM|nr:hypothetical protein [Candidatus Blautia merdigallinarum]
MEEQTGEYGLRGIPGEKSPGIYVCAGRGDNSRGKKYLLSWLKKEYWGWIPPLWRFFFEFRELTYKLSNVKKY